MNLPRPQTKRAILPSAGFAYDKATPHTYAETKPVFKRDEHGKPTTVIDGFEHIFVCTETNRRRRWGFEGRNPNQHGGTTLDESGELPVEITADCAALDAVPSDLTMEIARPMQRREGPGHDVIDPVTGGDM